jgi:hypothetical protein
MPAPRSDGAFRSIWVDDFALIIFPSDFKFDSAFIHPAYEIENSLYSRYRRPPSLFATASARRAHSQRAGRQCLRQVDDDEGDRGERSPDFRGYSLRGKLARESWHRRGAMRKPSRSSSGSGGQITTASPSVRTAVAPSSILAAGRMVCLAGAAEPAARISRSQSARCSRSTSCRCAPT